MTFAALLTQQVEVLSAAVVTTRSGDTEHDWKHPTVVTATKGFLQRRNSDDEELRRDRKWQRAKLYLLDKTPVLSTSRVRVQGEVWEVIGPPIKVFSPRGEHHIQCWVERVEG